MAGVPVTWTVTYGNAKLIPPGEIADTAENHFSYPTLTTTALVDTSDVNGDVQVGVRLGQEPGTSRVVAAAAGLPGATFTVTARGLQATLISVGFERACAIDLQGRTWCWGLIAGDSGSGPSTYVPRLVAGGHHFIELAAGEGQTCGLEASGAAWCWGSSYSGNLGLNGPSRQAAYNYPIPLASAPAFSHLFGGKGPTTCGVTSDGSAYCWGRTLGLYPGVAVPVPRLVPGGQKFRSIALGYTHACGIALDDTAWCWGDNGGGLLGAGSGATESATPLLVAGGFKFRSLTVTTNFSCGRRLSGGWVCWGTVPNGGGAWQLPAPAPDLDRYADFAAGDWYSSAIVGADAFTLPAFDAPYDQSAQVHLHALASDVWSACALAQDATVYCWGRNTRGELGNPDKYGWEPASTGVHAVVVPPNY